MWRPTENTIRKFHLAGSLATIVFGICVMYLCLAPDHVPGFYRILADERIAVSIPYLLYIALGEALFSLWYFLLRK